MLQHASESPRSVSQTCRHFGISRKAFYKWKKRHEKHGDAGLCDRPRAPIRSPNATSPGVVGKILYLRQNYHFGPRKIADYLSAFTKCPSLEPQCIASSPSMGCEGCRPTRSTSTTPNAGRGTKSRSLATVCRWT